MKPTLEDGLRALREAAELAPHIKIELTEEYLALIAQVEALPQNQAGADKSHIQLADRVYREFFQRVRLLPNKP
jgi:DNA-binding protein H-NS